MLGVGVVVSQAVQATGSQAVMDDVFEVLGRTMLKSRLGFEEIFIVAVNGNFDDKFGPDTGF
ncbi:MAG: hypothetical protein HLUCCO16_05880 [Phormidium sp. OSCR]|nr:MAG: hypothetical protein HLUCCO16_05880 [Phormidium sp. OSCR]